MCAPPLSIGSAQNGVPVANAIDGKTLLGVAALSVLLLSPSGLGVFGFDSAAYSYVAQVLQQGGVLYRDIWDNKQPGIYWFYQSVAQLIGNDWRALFIASTLLNFCWRHWPLPYFARRSLYALSGLNGGMCRYWRPSSAI